MTSLQRKIKQNLQAFSLQVRCLRLCSDGLTNYCTDNMIYETVFGNNLDEAIKQLIAFANECGGKDNITAAVIAN